MRLFKNFLLFILIPVMGYATLTPSTTCGGLTSHELALGVQSSSSTLAGLATKYYEVTALADGNLTVKLESSKDTILSIGDSCGGTNIYSGTNTTHNVAKFAVTKGQHIYFKITNTTNGNISYTLTLTYDAPIITVSLPDATKVIPEGFRSVDVNVSLNRGAVNGDVVVTYLNTYDNSIGTFRIGREYDSGVVTVDINTSDPTVVNGYSFDIILQSAVIDPSPLVTSTVVELAKISADHNTTTINLIPAEPDLILIKGDSSNRVRRGETFYYNIAVINAGSAAASDVEVIDHMPFAFFNDVNLTRTNAESSGWTCAWDNYDIKCDYSGTIDANATKIIKIYINVPGNAALGDVYNSASVSSDPADFYSWNNSDDEITSIVAEDYNEINEVEELCYSDLTNVPNPNNDPCTKTGNFWSGSGCIDTVEVNVDANLTPSDANLSEIVLTKMYAPTLESGTCTTTQGTCGANGLGGYQDIAIEPSPSYTKGYIFNVGTLTSDDTVTITDENSYYGNPKNPKLMDGIGLYATYKYNGVFHFGRVNECSGVPESGIQLESDSDAIDTPIVNATGAATYNTITHTSTNGGGIRWIQTMVASSQRNIVGVHLDYDYKQAVPYVFAGEEKYYSPFVILPYLVDGDEYGCTMNNPEDLFDSSGRELIIKIDDASHGGNGYSTQVTMAVPAGVRKNARLQFIVIDPNTLSVEGQQCLATSSTTGNIEGIGQCGNSEIQYVGGFGVDAWDRCGINNGQPCLSNNGGYSGGGNPDYPGYNPLYDNELGCYMCTFDIKPSCSTDNFSIRPERMDMGISHADAPNLLRAGQNYNVSLTAKDAANNIPALYTVTDPDNYNAGLGIDTKKYFRNGDPDTGTGLLNGDADLSASAAGYMVAGLSSIDPNGPATVGVADESVKVAFPDVGKVGLVIYDPVWGHIDYDDTPADCDSATHYYICAESNVTFIPHHFRFLDLNITNHGGPDNNFTYLANPAERDQMSAKIQTLIQALNKNGYVTQNFKEDSGGYQFYENNITVVPHIKDDTKFDTNKDGVYGDANESTIIDQRIGFGRSGLDDNGTRNILWDESSYPLNFNFKRDNNAPVNPFDINGTFLSISIVSKYVDSNDTDTAYIIGSRIGDENGSTTCATDPTCELANADNNATFFYGRSKSSKFLYDDVTTSSVNTPISVVVYCDEFPTCTLLPTYIQNFGQIDEPNWWLSLDHNESRSPLGDGSITLQASTGGSVDTDVSIIADAVDNTINVTNTSGLLPHTVDITHNGTDAWLIYNPYSPTLAPDPFYRVIFVGQSGWAGEGDTGNVVDSNASKKKYKRLQW